MYFENVHTTDKLLLHATYLVHLERRYFPHVRVFSRFI